MTKSALKVFTCYKWEDDAHNQWVKRLATDLRMTGIDAKLDVWDVRLGDSFTAYMTSMIAEADVVLFIVTTGSVAAVEDSTNRGRGVKFELQYATARRIAGEKMRLIGVHRGGEVTVSYLRDDKHADFRDDSKYEASLQELVDDLLEKDKRPPLGTQTNLDSTKDMSEALKITDREREMQKAIKILFADDSEAYRIDIGKDVEKRGYSVEYVGNSIDLRERVQREDFDIIILDLQMPDITGHLSNIAGIEDLKFLRDRRSSIPVIVLSSMVEDRRMMSEASRLGALECLKKDDVTNNRELLFDVLNGASAQVRTMEKLKEDKVEEKPARVGLESSLQFSIVPTGIYRQFDLGDFPLELVKHQITNNTNQEVRASISTRIERFSDPQFTELRLKSRSTAYVNHSPVLIPDEVARMRDIEDATLRYTFSYRIGDSELVKEVRSQRIQLHPVSTMYWALENVETGRVHNLEDFIAAWVTPRSKLVEEMLSLAVNHHPHGYIIGYQGPEGITDQEKREVTRTQIQAMYDALRKEAHIKYIEASKISFLGKGTESMQRVRLPDESLDAAAANCIDGSVLFASLIEGVSMNSAIVLVPGHAFVAWRTWDDSNEYEFLETTMLDTHDFADAFAEGMRKYNENLANGNFESGKAAIVDIRNARGIGIYPMVAR